MWKFDFLSINNEERDECYAMDPGTPVSECNQFGAGPERNWPHALTLTTPDDPNSNAAQTLVLTVASLPDGGANYRVAKTVANGNWFNGNAQLLLWERIQSLFQPCLSLVLLKFNSLAVTLVSLRLWQTEQIWFAVLVVPMQLHATTMLMQHLTMVLASSLMNAEFAVAQAWTRMPTAFAMMWTTALAPLTVVECATVTEQPARVARILAASNYDENNIFADNGQCVYATTFNVDMNCFDNAGASVNGATSLLKCLSPVLLGWAANDGYNQMLDDDGDGIYSVTLDFPAGTMEYKYAINGFADQEQLVDDMQNGGDCAPNHRLCRLRQPSGCCWRNHQRHLRFCSCAEQVEPVNVTFQVDMNQYAEGYAYGGVFVNGSFNGWCGGCNPMSDDDDADGIWTLTVSHCCLERYEYKFTLDGWNYQEEFAGGESCTSTIDGFTNRTVTFEAETTLPAVCWESCDVCPDIEDVLGCMDDSANNYNPDATVEPENSCLYDLTLSVDVSQTSFTGVTSQVRSTAGTTVPTHGG